MPWSALLSNGQKNAELSGFLAKVNGSYNPDTQDLFITQRRVTTPALPMPFGQRWTARTDAAAINNEDPPEDGLLLHARLEPRSRYTFARGHQLRSRYYAGLSGEDWSSSYFHGTNLRKNDFWIIAARPETPNVFVPWELSTGRAPHGVRRWIAPLGIIHWPRPNGAARSRGRLPSDVLAAHTTKGCCTYTVGDGTHSHGHFSKIQAAVDALPTEGGQVCLLPGVHRANVILVRGRNITVKGCGRQTRVIPRESNLNAPIFSIVDSQNITLEHMDLVSFGGIAVVVQSSQPGLSKAVEIHNNRIVGCRQAIQVRHGTQVGIHHNQIRVVDRENSDIAVFLQTEDSLIERNDIGVVSPEQFPPLEEPPEDGIADPADPCATGDHLFQAGISRIVSGSLVWGACHFLSQSIVQSARRHPDRGGFGAREGLG